MTTVDRILLKLDYLTKEQEGYLTLPALDDVIGQFESIFTIPYSEAGIPLLTGYLDKAKKTSNESPLTPEGQRLAEIDPDDAELTPEELKRVIDAKGARDLYNYVRKTASPLADRPEVQASLDSFYKNLMLGLTGSKPPVPGGGRRPDNKGKPPKTVRQLISGFAQQAGEVVDAIAEGKSEKEILGAAFPRDGLRMNMASDAGVDIEIKIQLNKDGKSFKIGRRVGGGRGKFKTIKGGEQKTSFGAAVKLGEDAIIARAKGRPAQFAGVDIGKNRRQNRAWLNANVRQDFGGPMTRMAATAKEKKKAEEDKVQRFIDAMDRRQGERQAGEQEEIDRGIEKFVGEWVAEYGKNISKQLDNAVDIKKLMQDAEENNGEELVNGASPDDLPSIIDRAPNDAVASILMSIAGQKITSSNQLDKVLKDTGEKVSKNKQHGAGSSNNDKPGSAEWSGRSEVKKGIGGIFSAFGKAFSSGFSEGWEKGQYFGSHTLGGVKYRAPDSEQYERDPRGYWAERGKLATMLARADNQYTDDMAAAMGMGEVEIIDKKIQQREVSFVDADGNTQRYMKNVNPREDAIENALVKFAKAEDKLEALAKDNTGSSLEAVREHVDQIRDGNKDVMPPSEGWADRDGGWQLRRQLEKNIEMVPDKPAGSRGSRAAERMMGPRGREKKATGEEGGIAQGEVGEARLTQQERPQLKDEPVYQMDKEGNPVLDAEGNQVPQLDEEGKPVTRQVVDPEGGKYTGAVDARADREYLKPGATPPEGVKEYTAERRGKDGKRARYYSRKEAAAVRDQQQNGGNGAGTDGAGTDGGDTDGGGTDPTPPSPPSGEPDPSGTDPDGPDPDGAEPDPDGADPRGTDPTPTPKSKPTRIPKTQPEPTEEDIQRLISQIRTAEREAKRVRETPPESTESEINTAGENEMSPIAAPKTPQNAQVNPQADQYQKAMENEVASAKRLSQHSKARSAKAQARVAKAQADEAEVRARHAEDTREINISELLHKLDSNIVDMTIKSNPDVSKVYSQLQKTIDSVEKDLRRDKSAINKQNPFAMLGGAMSRAFKEAGKPKKKPPTPKKQPKPKIPTYDPAPTPDTSTPTPPTPTPPTPASTTPKSTYKHSRAKRAPSTPVSTAPASTTPKSTTPAIPKPSIPKMTKLPSIPESATPSTSTPATSTPSTSKPSIPKMTKLPSIGNGAAGSAGGA